MDNKLQEFAELAMARGLKDLIVDQVKPGRLHNLCTKLQKKVDKALLHKGGLQKYEAQTLVNFLKDFGIRTGWENKTKHIVTYTSFCLVLFEESEFSHNPEIINILSQVYEYFENANDVYMPCFNAGELAHRKWKDLVQEYTGEKKGAV